MGNKSKMNDALVKKYLHYNSHLTEHDYSKSDTWASSEYLDQVIQHTAGAVIFSI